MGRAEGGDLLIERRLRHDLHIELARTIELGLRLRQSGVELADLARRLGNRRIGARQGSVVLGDQRIELGAVEPRQNLAFRHVIAIIGKKLDDAQAVDLRPDHRLIARHERARDEEAVDEIMRGRACDGDRRRQREMRFAFRR